MARSVSIWTRLARHHSARAFDEMNIANIPAVYSRKLQVGVWSAVVILALGLAGLLSHFVPLYDYDWMSVVFLIGGSIVFLAGLCGAYCGLSVMFTVRGFARVIGVLVALVSVYGVIRCLGYFGWAINLP